MTVAALVLYVMALVVLFGVRSWVQQRRTGSAGFHGISGTPADAGWWGGALFVAAIVLGLGGPLLAIAGVVPTDPPLALQGAGLAVAFAGFAATLAAQTGMGTSWRIGVDTGERTELVTAGVFAHVRNPVFTAMGVAQLGIVLTVPTWVGVLALAALVVAVQLQVRAVEEPYLRAVHGAAYDAYAATAGRFVPGLGRLPEAAGRPVGIS
ncbi:methyltransferase family protein [Blastococcus goldschmidtiae]|uniref:Isoprenylcysteine carboxylmethyltransferase family protein n=1 Tax=Blastococcus goldschmidtiae TaxID=3075546 RepID=A0ABU2K7K8_9ACTN|nr:isoprenylcysteine carboxylmethyltransferase family protein [Blastococcus sp. DSM 46792]MDT0276165.1 isoprenylcysteine carboxylmethyltransferase family protein [Blastococcus sp. DSM 46792]